MVVLTVQIVLDIQLGVIFQTNTYLEMYTGMHQSSQTIRQTYCSVTESKYLEAVIPPIMRRSGQSLQSRLPMAVSIC